MIRGFTTPTRSLCMRRQIFTVRRVKNEAGGGINPSRQVGVATKFYTVAINVSGSSVWNMLLASSILRWFLDFWKSCAPLK